MTTDRLPKPIIMHLPYQSINDSAEVRRSLMRFLPDGSSSQVDHVTMRYIFNYPTVYVVHSEKTNRDTSRREYTVYVGETNSIQNRTMQHLNADSKFRDDWREFQMNLKRDSRSVWQYVIGNKHFNKSLTLDVENRLMHYLLGSDAVKNLNNRRTNAQGDYYTQDEFDRIFSDIWLELHEQDPILFPAEQIIRDSALFKASPFHQLSNDQMEAEEMIMTSLSDVSESDLSRLIFVQGAAGTGKTVLLSHLFYRISTEMNIGGYVDEDDEDLLENEVSQSLNREACRKAYILVNHDQQVHVYNQIATKLGLQKKSGEVVLKPSQFINQFSEKAHGRGIPDKPLMRADVVLVDEAHLLLTQGDRGYSGKNMLHDLLRRAKVVIAVFDPKQILLTSQRWSEDELHKLFSSEFSDADKRYDSDGMGMEKFKPLDMWGDRYLLSHVRLKHQFRIAADEATIHWVDDFADGNGIGQIPVDKGEQDLKTGAVTRDPFEIKVFDSPVELFKAIKKKAELKTSGIEGHGLSRVVATYDWEYKGSKVNEDSPDGLWNVEMYRDARGSWHIGAGPGMVRGYDELAPDEKPDYFCHPWNYEIKTDDTDSFSSDAVWAESPHTINEVGSTFSIQGFDLNFVGVIIGPSVAYRDGKIIFDEKASHSKEAVKKRGGKISYAQANLRNELNVLLKRGVHGLYLFAVDPGLQAALKHAAE